MSTVKGAVPKRLIRGFEHIFPCAVMIHRQLRNGYTDRAMGMLERESRYRFTSGPRYENPSAPGSRKTGEIGRAHV